MIFKLLALVIQFVLGYRGKKMRKDHFQQHKLACIKKECFNFHSQLTNGCVYSCISPYCFSKVFKDFFIEPGMFFDK